jgi:uncharacterized protein (DUF1684 family)
MTTTRAVCALAVFLFAAHGAAAAGSSAPAAAPKPEAAAPASPIAAWEAWRAEENAAWSTKEFAILKIDDAVYLNEGQSAWLTNKKQKVLQYAWTLDALAAPSGLRVTYTAPKAEVVYKGKTQTFTLEKPQSVNVAPGIDVRFAVTQMKPGVDGLRVMVYNQAHPTARTFKGLDHFPYNASAVVEAKLERAAKAEGIDFQTSRGWYKRFYKMGEAVFTLEGKTVRLSMFAEDADPAKVTSLSTFFLDELAGKETYGVGRYIDIDVKGLPDTLTIDFNRAYNPNCARSPHYNCPLATDKIPLPVRAGEKIPPKH